MVHPLHYSSPDKNKKKIMSWNFVIKTYTPHGEYHSIF